MDWFHIATCFQHALQTAAWLGAGTINDYVGTIISRGIEHANGGFGTAAGEVA